VEALQLCGTRDHLERQICVESQIQPRLLAGIPTKMWKSAAWHRVCIGILLECDDGWESHRVMRTAALVAVLTLAALTSAGVAGATQVDCLIPSSPLSSEPGMPARAHAGMATVMTENTCAETDPQDVLTEQGGHSLPLVLRPDPDESGAISAVGEVSWDEVAGVDATTDSAPVIPTPEFSTLLLLGSAVAGLAWWGRNQLSWRPDE
jgi:hypothetical protein